MLFEAALALVMLAVLAVVLLVWAERVERRRRARWWRSHFHEGGLVKALIGRWGRVRRLTYRPDDSEP